MVSILQSFCNFNLKMAQFCWKVSAPLVLLGIGWLYHTSLVCSAREWYMEAERGCGVSCRLLKQRIMRCETDFNHVTQWINTLLVSNGVQSKTLKKKQQQGNRRLLKVSFQLLGKKNDKNAVIEIKNDSVSNWWEISSQSIKPQELPTLVGLRK